MHRNHGLHLLVGLMVTLLCSAGFADVAVGSSDACVECHTKLNEKMVGDWRLSAHSENDVSCTNCHGDQHVSAEDVEKALMATPNTCAECHEEQVAQFTAGKHSKAWLVMKAMPTAHWQPAALMEGMKGCGGCHKLGFKSEEEMKAMKKEGTGFGNASCDACHTRHLFSVKEARQPQACRTCHMGMDHPQWEMYSSSKHGVRFYLKQVKILPDTAAAPTCQTCHMQQGNHQVGTAWGFLAVRLPMPEDKQWAADRTTILQALGVLDPEGKPTPLLPVVEKADLARLTQEAWTKEREKMIATCQQCHSVNFAKGELAKGDDMIRQADRLMAEAIRIVAGLYKDRIIAKPETYAYPFPNLLTFHDAATVIEQDLFIMFLKHRMRVFQGTFHANPDYALWYGWSEMVRDLTKIKESASALRERAKQ